MSAIFLPRRWRHQPQGPVGIDPRWASRLKFAFLPSLGFQNLAAGAPFAQASADFVRGASTSGVTFEGNAKAEYAGKLEASGGLTLISVWRARSSQYVFADSYRAILSNRSSSNTGWQWGRYAAEPGGAGGSVTRQMFVLHGVAVYRESNYLIESLVDTPVAVRYSKSAGRISWFRFGQQSSPDVTASKSPKIGDSLVVGGLGPFSESSFTWLDRAAVVLAFVGELSDNEIAELTADASAPYQVFRAPSHRIWFDVGAGAGGGTTYNESLTESATVGDTLDPLASFFASYAESVTAADSAANAQTHAAALSESVTPADSATTAQSHAETLAESVTADDSAEPAQTMPVALSEDVTAGDALADEVVPAGSFNETIAESATVDDAHASTQAHVEALAEQISVGDGYTVTGGTEVEQRRGAPAGSPLRIWRYSARIGGRMVYADTQQALQAAIAEFEDSVPARAEKKAQKAGKVVVRRLPKVQIVEAPEEERGQVQAQAQAANDRIAAEYLAALQAQIAIREAMERDDMEAIMVLEFL